MEAAHYDPTCPVAFSHPYSHMRCCSDYIVVFPSGFAAPRMSWPRLHRKRRHDFSETMDKPWWMMSFWIVLSALSECCQGAGAGCFFFVVGQNGQLFLKERTWEFTSWNDIETDCSWLGGHWWILMVMDSMGRGSVMWLQLCNFIFWDLTSCNVH